ncbi:MAG TPA: polysulfide reductase NrfD [Syntrophorhabdaceae bacterium]|nr:polysulfide reductase NrfD [Syntrophorhabdaceae bacterium]
MIEKACKGSPFYWIWICLLLAFITGGVFAYIKQILEGLGITGMGRDVSWGLYIANFTFFVGIAASAVIVVLPYYIHDYKRFRPITILGEFLAVSSVIISILFIIVDLGMPSRVFNVLLYPSFSSILFWDMVVLTGYLILNMIIGWQSLDAEHKDIEPPKWIKPLVYISIPWAISIHTITAFIYSGIIARPFWHTALLAPRFLASAFASGPALLILICLLIKRFAHMKIERDAMERIALIATYSLAIHIFFFLVEIFTVFYSDGPEHKHHFDFLFSGFQEKIFLVPWAWGSLISTLIAFFALLAFHKKKNDYTLVIACILTVLSIWMEKGIVLIITGFIPTPIYELPLYRPTIFEIIITTGIYGIGSLVLTILLKVAISVRCIQDL